MTAERIAAAMDGKRAGRNQYRCRCPLCGGALIVSEADRTRNPLLSCYGRGCAQDELVAWAKSRSLWDRRYSVGTLVCAAKPEDAGAKRKRALQLFEDAGSPLSCRRYLRARGITVPPPPTLRLARQIWHPFAQTEADAVIALVEHVDDGPIGVHLTFLDQLDARKADLEPPKLTFGSFKGGAVRLAEPEPADWLVIGEGIETTLAAMQLSNLPGWAALSTSGLKNLILPDTIKKVIIAGDNDASGAGQRAAYTAADRFVAEGRQVKVAIPPAPGSDWNDFLINNGDS